MSIVNKYLNNYLARPFNKMKAAESKIDEACKLWDEIKESQSKMIRAGVAGIALTHILALESLDRDIDKYINKARYWKWVTTTRKYRLAQILMKEVW